MRFAMRMGGGWGGAEDLFEKMLFGGWGGWVTIFFFLFYFIRGSSFRLSFISGSENLIFDGDLLPPSPPLFSSNVKQFVQYTYLYLDISTTARRAEGAKKGEKGGD